VAVPSGWSQFGLVSLPSSWSQLGFDMIFVIHIIVTKTILAQAQVMFMSRMFFTNWVRLLFLFLPDSCNIFTLDVSTVLLCSLILKWFIRIVRHAMKANFHSHLLLVITAKCLSAHVKLCFLSEGKMSCSTLPLLGHLTAVWNQLWFSPLEPLQSTVETTWFTTHYKFKDFQQSFWW
jgi:hypothetical protein